MKFAAFVFVALAGSAAHAQLWDNGAIVNGSGLSIVDVGGTLLGAGHQANLGNTVAEDFSAADTWNVTGLSFFAYQSFAANTYTFTGASWQITNTHGDPISLTSSAVSNGGLVGYRVTATTLTNQDRAIFRVDITGLDLELAAGSYVIRWGLTGSLSSGPWAPYIPGSMGSGNARQSLTSGAYNPLVDGGTGLGVELPFIINGTVVPAPTSLALLGVAGLVARRRR